LALLIHLADLRGYIGRDQEDLSIRDLKHVTRVVEGDDRTDNLEREALRGRHTVDVAVMSWMKGRRSFLST
jgi:hypothetical protein